MAGGGVGGGVGGSSSLGEEPLNKELYRIPGHAGWFSWNAIHSIEREALLEFFEGKTLSKTPKIYKEYRDFMINKYRENPRRVLTFTEIRKMLVGDVNCLRRVYEFLEQWGLINYSAVTEVDAPGGSSVVVAESAPPGMQIVFPAVTSAKSYGTTSSSNLGSRENVFQSKAGPQGSPNKVQAQADGSNDEWTPQETMLLLEGITKYSENWTRVAQHVVTKTRKQCIKKFVQLPFGDQFLTEENGNVVHLSSPASKSMENGTNQGAKHASKKQKVSHAEGKDVRAKSSLSQAETQLLEEAGITPFSDSSNPLIAQIAFMSAMVGPRVAAAAAQAALAVIAEEEPAVSQLPLMTPNVQAAPLKDQNGDSSSKEPEAGTTELKQSEGQGPAESVQEKEQVSAARIRAGVATALAAAAVNAKTLADQEEREIEALMANIIETQLKKLYSKLEHFEELEHLMEKEWQQLEQMREQIFLDCIQLRRQQFPAGTFSAAQDKAA